MSGGSYNFLCFKDDDQLFEYGIVNDLDNMATELIELGYEDAAKETLHLKYTIQQARIRAQVMKERLVEVWRAVEYNQSGDSSKDAIEEAVKKYRGEE